MLGWSNWKTFRLRSPSWNGIAKKGLRGSLIWGAPPEDRPYSLPDYDPFWAAAQDLQIPLSLHILTGRGGVQFDLRRVLYGYMKLPQEVQLTFADMIAGGVFERFPRLKVVSAENDVSWIPHFLYRLDHAYDRLRHLQGLTLSMLPSDYMRRNMLATFQFESSNVEFTRQIYGADNIGLVVRLSAHRLDLAALSGVPVRGTQGCARGRHAEDRGRERHQLLRSQLASQADAGAAVRSPLSNTANTAQIRRLPSTQVTDAPPSCMVRSGRLTAIWTNPSRPSSWPWLAT